LVKLTPRLLTSNAKSYLFSLLTKGLYSGHYALPRASKIQYILPECLTLATMLRL
jgi:hypothetical protein